jgi:DNA-binding IclR family transcriptional regulator
VYGWYVRPEVGEGVRSVSVPVWGEVSECVCVCVCVCMRV